MLICPGWFSFSLVEVRFLLRRQAEGLVDVALEVLSQDLPGAAVAREAALPCMGQDIEESSYHFCFADQPGTGLSGVA